MMKLSNIIIAVCTILLISCSNDDVDSANSIFDTSERSRNEFEQWIKKNYTDPYNIQFEYLYNDKLTDNTYNVVPATIEKSKALAILIKHVWMDAYTTIGGTEFLKNNCYRQIQIIGSAEYDNGSIVLGTAEGGLKILLFRANELDLNNIYINQDDPYRSHYETPLDINYWFLHTMHHEYCHILTQRKNYTTDFQVLYDQDKYKSGNIGVYKSSDWVNLEDTMAAKYGFVTGYASMEYNEDFAEVYSNYVTHNDTYWNKILAKAIRYTDDDGNALATPDTRGRDLILEKLAIVKDYFKESWDIDLEALRAEVIKRSSEAPTLDLKTLK